MDSKHIIGSTFFGSTIHFAQLLNLLCEEFLEETGKKILGFDVTDPIVDPELNAWFLPLDGEPETVLNINCVLEIDLIAR